MITKKLLYIISIYISVCCFSCIDEISLNVDTEERTLVVDGFISDFTADYTLKLSLSSVIGIGNDNILDPVPGATVVLLDDRGETYPYQEVEQGIYNLTGFAAERLKSYQIDITLPDGRRFQSKPQQLRSSSLIDDISYEIEEKSFRNNAGDINTELVLSMLISTDISQAAEPPFLRWRVEGEYQLQEGFPGALNLRRCYVKENLDLNDIRIFDASELNGNVIFDQVIAETFYNFRFADQFCFHVSQYSITEEEYEYWSNIKEIIDINGGLFDPPPGTVVGNMINVDDPTDIAVGYFSVSSVFFTRQFINSNELDFFVEPKCSTRGFRDIPFGCRDCSEVNNSTLDRPTYWEF